MENIKLTALTNKISFTGDLYIDNLFLLAPKSTPVSQELINALQLWQFEDLQLDGNVSLGGDIGVSTNGNKNQDNSEENKQKENLGSSVKKVLEDSRAINIANDESLRLNMVKNVYLEYANYIESVYTHYSTHKEINQEELSETVQELCIFVKDNKRFLLRLLPDTSLINKNFLVIHSLRCTVLAIATALQLHMPLSKMIELGVCCILHEIGMLQLPPQIYMGSKQLTPGEKAMISKHPVYGHIIVKNLNFPTTIQLGILEHHEKENGTGYPRRLPGDKLSYTAKIISVICSYEAITSKRNYKSERSSLDGMVELLLNKNNTYSPDIVRALLHTFGQSKMSNCSVSYRKTSRRFSCNSWNRKSWIRNFKSFNKTRTIWRFKDRRRKEKINWRSSKDCYGTKYTYKNSKWKSKTGRKSSREKRVGKSNF